MIKGSIVAIVTPMQADGALDIPALRKLIDWRAIGLFMIGILPGTFLGAWGLDMVDPVALRTWIGIFLLFLGS